MAHRLSRHAQSPLHLPLDDPQRRRLPPLLRRAWYSLNQAFRRRIAHLDLTPDQFTVLRTLLEADPAGPTQRELTVAMSSDPNTVASLLRRMEKAGLLERRPHESDRRARRIHLLPLGRRRYETARNLALELQGEVLAVLPEKEREKFLENLAAVANACRTASGSPARGE
jgi:DNA-binding MarR family transcriptional regulator